MAKLIGVLNKVTKNTYERIFLERATVDLALHEQIFGKIVGHRKVKVPRYLTIKVPVITRDYSSNYDGERGEFRGWLISFNEVNVCKIGTTIEKQPIYRKLKTGQTIRFVRYGGLK